MNPWQELVRTFHRDVTKQPISPAEPELRMPELRARLLLEEAIETVVALVGKRAAIELIKTNLDVVCEGPADEPNLIEALDGLCDVTVIVCGTAESIGVDLDPFMIEVMRSNMAKAGGPMRADGKVLKTKDWTPPDLKLVLAREANRYSRFKVGDRIVTTSDACSMRWSDNAKARRRPWGYPGTVKAVHDAHGVTYEVHVDGCGEYVYQHEEVARLPVGAK